MNSRSLHLVQNCTKLVVFTMSFFLHVHVKAWEIDLSRRSKDIEQQSAAFQKPVQATTENNPVDAVLDGVGPSQEIVIMNTDHGFVPETVRMRKGTTYRVHLINVNEKEKNVSFMLDAFNEHDGIYFGQPKSFTLNPKVDGVFTFVCPETAKQGHLVIVSDGPERKPAAQ